MAAGRHELSRWRRTATLAILTPTPCLTLQGAKEGGLLDASRMAAGRHELSRWRKTATLAILTPTPCLALQG